MAVGDPGLGASQCQVAFRQSSISLPTTVLVCPERVGMIRSACSVVDLASSSSRSRRAPIGVRFAFVAVGWGAWRDDEILGASSCRQHPPQGLAPRPSRCLGGIEVPEAIPGIFFYFRGCLLLCCTRNRNQENPIATRRR